MTMLSVKDIAVVKIAVEICNNPNFKKEILCEPEVEDNGFYSNDQKEKWEEKIKESATVITKELELPEKLQDKVLGVVYSVGMRMLKWAVYHERTFGFSREHSINFLNSSFFTQKGLINNRKVSEELLSDKCVSTEQKYKLSCLHCFTDRLTELYFQMPKMKQRKFYTPCGPPWIKQPGLVIFWTYYLMNKVNKVTGRRNIDEYMLEKAIESGSKVAVEYCLEKTKVRDREGFLVHAAMLAMRYIALRDPYWHSFIIFYKQKYDKKTWIPLDYYVDILCYLLSTMREDQQVEFFKKYIVCFDKYADGHRCVLEQFLQWPHKDFFWKSARLMWDSLPETFYGALLCIICDKIKSSDETFTNGDEKLYDYRELFKECFTQSPETCKRFVSHDDNRQYTSDILLYTTIGVALISKLLMLNNFTIEDRENIKIILDSVTDVEKENILHSNECKRFCTELVRKQKWEILNRFFQICFISKVDVDNFMKHALNRFKRDLSLKEIKQICIDLLKNDKWCTFESLVNWSNLRETKVKTFKQPCIFGRAGLVRCANLVLENELESLCEHIILLNLAEEDVKKLKRSVADKIGCTVLEPLISQQDCSYILDMKNFLGCTKWEKIEMFMTWCFSTEQEISDFKKNKLVKNAGINIHFNLIKSNQWEEAETFFAWLGLTSDEIRDLKKETLFKHAAAKNMFRDLMVSREGDTRFVQYGSKQDAIELLLRWYLLDKETVLEFKKKFEVSGLRKCDVAVLKNFDLMIEQRLRDIDEEKMQVKRKSETVSPNKRLCIGQYVET